MASDAATFISKVEYVDCMQYLCPVTAGQHFHIELKVILINRLRLLELPSFPAILTIGCGIHKLVACDLHFDRSKHSQFGRTRS